MFLNTCLSHNKCHIQRRTYCYSVLSLFLLLSLQQDIHHTLNILFYQIYQLPTFTYNPQ
nr:MAG TPA: hypothetical protein [Caudoviricetes sp.]